MTTIDLGRPVSGDVVELILHFGGEVVADIARKEAFEERDQQPPALFGEKAVLLHPDIGPVTQDLDRRGVSRGSADPELLELFDQACLGKARRRLGEVLARLDRLLRRAVALVDRR